MFQNLMLSKCIDTKKELIKLEVERRSYKLLRFEYISLPLIDQKTQRKMFEKTLRNSLAPYFNLRYLDTQEKENQLYEFRAEKLKNPKEAPNNFWRNFQLYLMMVILSLLLVVVSQQLN
jgi:ABC-type transporter lipoprotein component MlaA